MSSTLSLLLVCRRCKTSRAYTIPLNNPKVVQSVKALITALKWTVVEDDVFCSRPCSREFLSHKPKARERG